MSEQSPQFHEQWKPSDELQPTEDLYSIAQPEAQYSNPHRPQDQGQPLSQVQYPTQPQAQYQPTPAQPAGFPAGASHPYVPMPHNGPTGVPAPFGYEPSTGLPYSDKSKVVAGVLQILLGGLGVGRFYKGDIGIGILQILVTICTLGFGWLWPLIDGIVMLTGRPTDKQGRPLRG